MHYIMPSILLCYPDIQINYPPQMILDCFGASLAFLFSLLIPQLEHVSVLRKVVSDGAIRNQEMQVLPLLNYIVNEPLVFPCPAAEPYTSRFWYNLERLEQHHSH